MNKQQFQELPLVKSVCSFFPKISLNDVLIIGCQHLLPTTLQMFYSLINKGLKPKNVYLLGKCYSTDPQTYRKMLKIKLNPHPLSFKFESNLPYDQLYEKKVKTFFNEILNTINLKNFKKIIILDDGGSLISLANQLLMHNFSNIVGIEQTSAGYNRINQLKKLHFPIINVARSKAKLTHENFLVAEIISKKILKHFKNSKQFPQKVLIIGNGPIGQAINQLLNTHFSNIDCFDLTASRSTISLQKYKASLNSYDMIIGCTGKSILTKQDFNNLKKGVILVSASSSDREFNAFSIRKNSLIKNTFNTVHLDIHTKDLILLNNGFPVNFDKDYSKIDHKGFQLTRSLLTGAIFQALYSKSKPLSPILTLLPNLQNKILYEFYNYYPNFSDKESSNQSNIKYPKALSF